MGTSKCCAALDVDTFDDRVHGLHVRAVHEVRHARIARGAPSGAHGVRNE
jgi:hypothetical protein